MKKIALILALIIVPCCLVFWLRAAGEGEIPDAPTIKRKADDLYERGQFEQSADMFQKYIALRPGDTKALYDYAMLLAKLDRNAEAAEMLEACHRLDPRNEAAYFKLGAQYVILKRDDQAAKIFEELQQSTNPETVRAAAEAAARLKQDLERAARAQAEQNVYDLARQFKYDEVVSAVDDLEKTGELSYAIALQRIYALSNLQKYSIAYDLAESLVAKYPDAVDLQLTRAELLLQLGRQGEAIALLEEISKKNPNTPYSQAAEKRIEDIKALQAAAAKAQEAAAAATNETAGTVQAEPVAPPAPTDEEIIYSLADKRQHKEVVAAIDELEKKRGNLDWIIKMQRLYALQAMGDTTRALQEADKMIVEQPDSVELAVMRADLLIKERRWQDASLALKDLRDKHPGTPLARESDRRLAEIPAVENLDKWNWGESYMSGDYHGRFDTLIGYGYIRTGTYIPKARQLQPYVDFNYVVDTKSGAGARQTIISDNSVGFYGGIRYQFFPREYLFLYAQAGGNKDLLDRRNGGKWRGDFMAGIYGYKAWGPGVNWKRLSLTNDCEEGCKACPLNPTLRSDWWVDAGGDFSWYDRFNSWLGYAQLREGLRLAQFGNAVAFDAYFMQNLAWDVKGNYTDNLLELGPGVRLVWVPGGNWQVVLRTEWAQGFYLGRDDTNQRGNIGSSYDDFRVGLSVGVNW